MKQLVSIIVMLAVVFATSPATAQLIADEDRNAMRQGMQDYFDAEETEALVMLIFGVLSFGGGLAFVLEGDDLVQAAGIPVAAVGGLQILVGSTVYFRTPDQRDELDASLAATPRAYLDAELPRMRDVRFWYDVYMIVETVLLAAGVGVATVGFIRDNDFAKGFGIGLAAQSGVMLGFDLIAQSQADRYASDLVDFARKLNVPLDAEDVVPVTLQLQVRF